MFELLIRNGTIVDGQNRPRYEADIGVVHDRIAAIGQLGDAEAQVVIDASDRVVAPGFIDVHTHSDAILLSQPHLISKTLQGFTTEFLMLDGISYAPVNRRTVHGWIHYLRSLNGLRFEQYTGWESIGDFMSLLDGKTAQNVATFIPYANVRTLALGFGERQVNDYQLVDLQNLVRQGMADGACGLSTGLDYVDECFASTGEIIAAAQGMRAEQGVYVTHVRYARGTLEGVKEAVEIGKRAGLSISATNERIRKLEARGLISGWGARVDAATAGLDLLAFMLVLVGDAVREDEFRKFVHARDEIQECHHVTGEWSYLLKVRTAGTAGLEELLGRLKATGLLARSMTMIALSSVKETVFVPVLRSRELLT